ncbi:nickel-dependent hydrogenase large subunit [Escherichia coli]
MRRYRQRRSHHLCEAKHPATGEFEGVGFRSAARYALSTGWLLKTSIISNYQAVVPSTWNSAST